MEYKQVKTKRSIFDTFLNVLVVLSLALGLFFLFKPDGPRETRAPLNSQYTITRLQPLADNDHALYTDLAILDESSVASNTSSSQPDLTESHKLAASNPTQPSSSQPTSLQRFFEYVLRIHSN